MNLYCIYILSNMYIAQPSSFHTCKFQRDMPVVQQVDRGSEQARKNMREAIANPVLMHIIEQQKEQQTIPMGFTIRF